jgi:flagellar M-ring protein FliF
MPTKSVFVSEQEDTTASVTLTLKPDQKLTFPQVQGIGALFIGSVHGLKPENLHIIDSAGNVLSDELSLASSPDLMLTKATVEQMRLQREYERDLEKKIRQMLVLITGLDNFVATVTAELDFNKQEINRSTNENPDNLKISEHHVRETGRAGDFGGPVGTDSNITQVPFAQTLNSTNYTREEDTINYQTGTSQEMVIQAPGQVKRLSVAVVINDNTDLIKDEGKIKDAVAAAIGFNYERGDQISVTSQFFDDSAQRRADAEAKRLADEKAKNQLYMLIAAGILLLLLLLILLIAWIASVLRRRRERKAERLAAELEEREAAEVAAMELADQEELAAAAAIAELEPRIPEPVETKQDLLRKMAGDKPNDIADVLKLWLRD